VSDEEIPYESPAETADGHLTAAENYLVIAEDGFAKMYEEPGASAPAGVIAADNHGKTRFAIELAELHRKMAETYWNQPAQRIEITQHPEAWLTRPVPDGQGGLIDASVEEAPCDCCSAGLINATTVTADDDSTIRCADCLHPTDRHNGNAPDKDPRDGLNGPGESALIEAASRAGSAGWRQVSEWLAACADANREGRHWPPLIAAPASVMGPMKGGNVPVSEYSRDLGAKKPWRSPGGAGQWNG
jgi:hypothetical protein